MLLRRLRSALEGELRGRSSRDDDYRRAGKPTCDYDDPRRGEKLVDALAKDAYGLLLALDGGRAWPELSRRRRCSRRSLGRI